MTSTNAYYTNAIEYTTGKYSGKFEYGSVSGINNLKKEDNVAKLNVGKDTATKNRPSKLTLRQFNISLPTGAEISSVKVEYAHRKVNGSGQKKAPTVLAPTIYLVGFGSGNNPSKKGVAPTTTMTARSVTFSFKPSKAQVESPSFGVHIAYPKNTNDASGYIELKYMRIIINYTAPDYQLLFNRWGSTEVEIGEKIGIATILTNLNRTAYNPLINISLDEAPGCVFDSYEIGLYQANGENITWNPQVQSPYDSRGAFYLYCSTSGFKKVKMSFSLNGKNYYAEYSFTVKAPAPVTETTTESTDSKDNVKDNVETPSTSKIRVKSKPKHVIPIELELPSNWTLESFQEFYLKCDKDGLDLLHAQPYTLSFYENDEELEKYDSEVYKTSKAGVEFAGTNSQNRVIDDKLYIFVACKELIKCELTVYLPDMSWDSTGDLYEGHYIIETVPDEKDLSTPYYSILKIDDEEILNRLGDTIPYTISSSLKVDSTDTYISDWGKNFKIGVFNNPIEENLLSRLDYTSIDDKINIIFNPPEPEGDYKLVLNPSNNLLLERLVDENNDEYEYELFDKNKDTELSNHDCTFKSDYDQVDFTAKLINTKYNSIYWSQNYQIKFNQETNEEIKETIIDNTDYTNLSHEEIIKHADYWSTLISEPNISEEKTVEFNYDEDYPLYIIFTGGYSEEDFSKWDFSFTPPILFEHGTLDNRNPQTYFPIPIKNLSENNENVTLELPNGKSSNPIILYDLGTGETFQTGESLAIRGLLLTFDVDYSDDFIVTVQLKSPEGKKGTRSFIIQGYDSTINAEALSNTITLGGSFDLWGFKISEMINLDNWEIKVTIDNSSLNSNAESTIVFGNVLVSFYYITFQDDLIVIYINGEDSRHYGMFIQNVDVPPGLKSEVKYYDIDGSDFNNAYRMNIGPKEISFEFDVNGCTIFETTELLKEIAKLMVNKKDNLNQPILNRFECSLYPNEHWDYILEDPLDTDVEDVAYNSKVKLKIPDGTSWANEDTVTSINGYNNSVTGVNPIIEVSPTEGFIELTETISKQHFSLKYDNYKEGDIVIIDCVNQEVLLKQLAENSSEYIETDITEKADYNVDWFKLPVGEFNFDTQGTCGRCIITFTERG